MDDFRAASLFELTSRHVRGPRVLDVGCGTGGLVIFLAQRGFDVIGIDTSRAMVANGRAALERVGLSGTLIREGDAGDVDGVFDTVTALDVIEHIENDRRFLEALARHVTPGGRLIVSVPAIPWLFGPKDVAVGHYRRYRPERLRETVAQTGLTVSKVRYWNFCGLAPTVVASKVLRRAVNEKFRYDRSWKSRVVQTVLRSWLSKVENKLDMPIGLSLFLIAQNSAERRR